MDRFQKALIIDPKSSKSYVGIGLFYIISYNSINTKKIKAVLEGHRLLLKSNLIRSKKP